MSFFRSAAITVPSASYLVVSERPAGCGIPREAFLQTQQLFQALNITPPLLTQDTHSIYFVPRCLEEHRGVAFAIFSTRWAVHMREFLDAYDVGEFYRDAYLYRKKDSVSPYVTSLYDLIVDEHDAVNKSPFEIFPKLIETNLIPLPKSSGEA